MANISTRCTRYARRAPDKTNADEQAELRSDFLTTLLEFASQRAAQEDALEQFNRQQAAGQR